ncbi:MAG: hypothetical protein JXR07_02335 [Reichenbachiella sp.]
MPVSYIEYKGKEILFINLKDMSEQPQLIDDGIEAARIIKERNERLLFLCDFTNASVGTQFMSRIKDDGKYILKNIPIKTAVTGITGLKNILIQGYIKFTDSKLRIFDTLEEAQEYLVDGE